jgi:lipid-binding SYLF domain-containing protein
MIKTGFVTAVVLLFACSVCAARPAKAAEGQESASAAQTLRQMTASNKVPKSLLDQSQCIGVVPNLTKAGLLVGGEHGSGLVSCRTSSGWSAPAFFGISGGSIGLEAGAQTSQIILLMNKRGKEDLLKGKFQLTANAVAAGPTGSNYSASAGWKAPILSYKQSQGAYAGASIQGSTISMNNGDIHKVYGQNVTAHQVLSGSVRTPRQAQQFTKALPQG